MTQSQSCLPQSILHKSQEPITRATTKSARTRRICGTPCAGRRHEYESCPWEHDSAEQISHIYHEWRHCGMTYMRLCVFRIIEKSPFCSCLWPFQVKSRGLSLLQRRVGHGHQTRDAEATIVWGLSSRVLRSRQPMLEMLCLSQSHQIASFIHKIVLQTVFFVRLFIITDANHRSENLKPTKNEVLALFSWAK